MREGDQSELRNTKGAGRNGDSGQYNVRAKHEKRIQDLRWLKGTVTQPCT